MPVPTQHTSPAPTGSPSRPAAVFPALEHFRVPGIPPAAYYIPDFISPDEETYLLRRLAETPQPKWKTVGTGRRLQYWGGNMSKNGVLLPEPLPDFLTGFPDIIERLDSFLDVASGRSDEQVQAKADRMLGINQVLVNEYQPEHGIAPHEDGPAFRPLVATLSLGSHTIVDIHHYLSTTSPSPPMTASPRPAPSSADAEARPIAAIPLAHLLVLPRSLLILSSSLYTSHLHGITARTVDAVQSPLDGRAPTTESGEVVVANANLVGEATVVDAMRDGGCWRKERGVRTSLTFRHAEKVLKGGAFAMALGGLRRG